MPSAGRWQQCPLLVPDARHEPIVPMRILRVAVVEAGRPGLVNRVAGGTPPPTFRTLIDFRPAMKVCRRRIIETLRYPSLTHPTLINRGLHDVVITVGS